MPSWERPSTLNLSSVSITPVSVPLKKIVRMRLFLTIIRFISENARSGLKTLKPGCLMRREGEQQDGCLGLWGNEWLRGQMGICEGTRVRERQISRWLLEKLHTHKQLHTGWSVYKLGLHMTYRCCQMGGHLTMMGCDSCWWIIGEV